MGGRARRSRALAGATVATVTLCASPRAHAQHAPPPASSVSAGTNGSPPPGEPSRASASATSSAQAPGSDAPPAAQPAPDDAARATARAHFERGVELASASRWREAIDALEQARAIRPTAAVHFNLGVAYRAVGRFVEALASLREYERAAPAGADAVRAEASAAIAVLQRQIARITVEPEPAEGAAVSLDGAPLAARAPREVDPGRHVVLVEAPEHRTLTRVVSLAPGESLRIEARLVPVDNSARVQVECNVPDAAIALDGRVISYGTADEYVLPGRHAVAVRAPGRATFAREVLVLPGGTTRIHAALSDARGLAEQPWFWVGAGVLAAGLIAGAVLVFSSTEPRYVGPLGAVDALTVAP